MGPSRTSRLLVYAVVLTAGIGLAVGVAAALFSRDDLAITLSDRQPKVDATSRGVTWPPFPRSRYWSKPIPASAQTDPNSARWSAYVQRKLADNPQGVPLLAVHEYGVPIWVARRNAPVERIGACDVYACPSLAGARVRVPRGARPDPGSDRHLVIVDPRRDVSYELFYARRRNGVWRGAGGGRVLLRSGDGAALRGSSGPTAAKLSLLAGLVRPQDIRAGRINHALAITVPGIGPGAPRCPARANIPTTDNPDAPPEGTRLQLDPSVDLDAYNLPRLQRIIATAMQRYGMIINDNGGKVAIRAENFVGKKVDVWKEMGYARDADSVVLEGIPMDRLRVISQPTC